MNPAQRVSATLRAEHSVMRQTLSRMSSVLRAGEWRRPGPALERLRELVEFEQVFDEACHQPKCEALRQGLRQRSGDVNRTLPVVEARRCTVGRTALLVHGLLAAIARSEPGADEALAPLLEQYHAGVLHRMQWEESVLLAAADTTLSSADWHQVEQGCQQVPALQAAVYELDATRTPARRRAESPARFEDTGFALDAGLSFERVPLFCELC